MKKWLPWLALVLCALLLAAIVFGVIQFVKLMNQTQNSAETQPKQAVDMYFQTNWEGFTFALYDDETDCVVLQKQFDITFEQAQKFGKECYEDLALGHIDTMAIMRSGCMANCGVELSQISISGLTSDGQVMYTVFDDGRLTACWDE